MQEHDWFVHACNADISVVSEDVPNLQCSAVAASDVSAGNMTILVVVIHGGCLLGCEPELLEELLRDAIMFLAAGVWLSHSSRCYQ